MTPPQQRRRFLLVFSATVTLALLVAGMLMRAEVERIEARKAAMRRGAAGDSASVRSP